MTERQRKLNRLVGNLGFVLLFGKVSDTELVKIVLWTKDQIDALRNED